MHIFGATYYDLTETGRAGILRPVGTTAAVTTARTNDADNR